MVDFNEHKKYIDKIEKDIIYANTVNTKCIIEGCSDDAISSHFPPQNSWLTPISKNSQFYCITKAHSLDVRGLPYQLTKKGKKEVLAIPLFCNKHDNELFKDIDKIDIDYENYKTQVLICFRTICAIIRQCDINITAFSRSQKDIGASSAIEKEELIKKELLNYKCALQHELNHNENLFQFELFTFDRIDVCASNICSFQEFNSFFVNIFPYKENKTAVLLGYLKSDISTTLLSFVDLWKEPMSFTENLTYYMAAFPENWVISEKLRNSLNNNNLNYFISDILPTHLTGFKYPEGKFNIFK